jgi:hypothetical protein
MKSEKNTQPSLTQKLKTDDAFQAGFIAIFFTVGILGHVFLPDWMVILTPPVLWAYGLLVAAFAAAGVPMDGLRSREDAALRASQKRARLRLIVWIVLTYAVTFALEAIGTATGLVFGPYDYGNVLGVMVLAVPVVIGFNWVLVVLGALRIVQRLPWWAAIPGAAVLTTAFDFLMETGGYSPGILDLALGRHPAPELSGLVLDILYGGGGLSCSADPNSVQTAGVLHADSSGVFRGNQNNCPGFSLIGCDIHSRLGRRHRHTNSYQIMS